MVGIVVVSHSDALARGVVALAREMSPPELALEVAGGIGEAGVLGTSAELVGAAIERAMSADGVLVLMDLGSALMSAELAVELLEGASGPVRLSAAPLVEGTVAAAASAGGGATLEQVAAEADGALAMKSAQIGDASAGASGALTAPVASADAEAELAVENELGLHARPAARFVETVGRFDAEVLVARAGSAATPVSARSLTNIVALGARRGDRLRVRSSGPQARAALAALQELAVGGFGDGPPVPTAPPAAGTVLRGVAASRGVAGGDAQPLVPSAPLQSRRDAASPEDERALLERALDGARAAVSADRERLRARAGAGEAEIFDAHLALLDDEALLEPARAAIGSGAPAELAIADAAEQLAAVYRRLENPLLAERATDVLDVGRRIVAAVTADCGPSEPKQNDNDSQYRILVADELTPSQTAGLDRERIAGIATARGSATAHAAIIARALGIPAVVGLGESILAVPAGTRLLLDGTGGTVTIAPADRAGAEQAVADAEARSERGRAQAAAAREHAHQPALLAGGEQIEIFANAGSLADAQLAVECGAEGVGLLRTEFLFLGRAELPGEDEQAETLRQIAVALGGRPLIVRTLDAGADKPLPALALAAETNPFLGVRGIRVGLRNPELLAAQLRAVLRVAAEHPLKLMLPMVATVAEVVAVRELLEQARAQTGVTVGIELGIMVEVPAAALMAAELAPHVDFFSLGTNDLTQYTMAAERGNAQLEPLLAEPQPAVLRLVRATVAAADAHGRWVGVCGELAGDPAAAVLLTGLGVSELSMAPRLIPEVKQALRGLELGRARAAAALALEATSAEGARAHGLELLSGSLRAARR
ncbi:MAG TPA: phosphoenolpyruvate--protein phosphotransferase [Solirubrobacteraceae bacterium]|nr:phosphoenolpyruvate--protein phosphotransferase [Solirubrobacteraceae bacterium]